MINLIVLLLVLSFLCVLFISSQIVEIKKSVDYDRIERITIDYHKYYNLYKECCCFRGITTREGLSIKEMQKVIDETVLKY